MEKVGKNNRTITLNVLHAEKEKIYPAHILKHNWNHEKQCIILMIPNGEGWHYLGATKILALLRGVTSKHHGNFYCLNCPHPFATEKLVNLVKRYVKIKIFATS